MFIVILAWKAVPFQSNFIGIFMLDLQLGFLDLGKTWVADEVLVLADGIIHELFVCCNAFVWDKNARPFDNFVKIWHLLLLLSWIRGLIHRVLIWLHKTFICIQIHNNLWCLARRFIPIWCRRQNIVRSKEIHQIWSLRRYRWHEILSCVVKTVVVDVCYWTHHLATLYGFIGFLLLHRRNKPIFVALVLVLDCLWQ